MDTVLVRLGAGGVTAELPGADSSKPSRRILLSRGPFAEKVRLMLYAPEVSRFLPLFVVSSTIDPITPSRWGDEVARNLQNSRHILVPNAGHSPSTRCVMEIERQFLIDASHARLGLRCLDEARRPRFALELPQRLPATQRVDAAGMPRAGFSPAYRMSRANVAEQGNEAASRDALGPTVAALGQPGRCVASPGRGQRRVHRMTGHEESGRIEDAPRHDACAIEGKKRCLSLDCRVLAIRPA